MALKDKYLVSLDLGQRQRKRSVVHALDEAGGLSSVRVS